MRHIFEYNRSMSDDVTRDVLTTWVENYRRAWESNDPDDIRALFTEDALYFTSPHEVPPWQGREQIVAGWLRDRDEPGTTTFEWHPVVVTEDTAVVQGRTVYVGDRSYKNLWVIRLAPDGRASEFTEWYMEEK
jgi:ketosteroid isomerase-like protein